MRTKIINIKKPKKVKPKKEEKKEEEWKRIWINKGEAQ